MIRAQQQPFEPVLVHQGQQQQWCSNWPRLRRRPSTTIHQRWPKWRRRRLCQRNSEQRGRAELSWAELFSTKSSDIDPRRPFRFYSLLSTFTFFHFFFHFWSLIMNVHQRKKKKNASGWLAGSTCMSHPCLTFSFPFFLQKNNKEDGDLQQQQQQRRPLNWQKVEFWTKKVSEWVKTI